MSLLYKLPLAARNCIYEYDDTPKCTFDLCMKELRKNIKKIIYEYKENYKNIEYFHMNIDKIRYTANFSKNNKFEKLIKKYKLLMNKTIKMQTFINNNGFDVW